MARRVVASSYGETDLIVELARCRDVTFLLYMEAHSEGTGGNAATLISYGAGDNPLVVLVLCDSLTNPCCDWVFMRLRNKGNEKKKEHRTNGA